MIEVADAMFNKRGRPSQEEDEPPLRRLRRNIGDLFLSNQVSATRAQSLFNDAALDNAACREMVPKGSANPKGRHRDIINRLLKGCQWPPLYMATIPIFNKKTLQKQYVQLAFLLPHEICHKFCMVTDGHVLFETVGMSQAARGHLRKMCAVHGCRGLGVSLWMDGTPCNYDRTQSLESVTMGFPGLKKPNDTMRVPLTVITKHYCIKYETVDAILSVVQWSLECLAAGIFPTKRHTGDEFAAEDKFRRTQAGKPLGCHGFLCEVKADWALLTEVFRFPAWNLGVGCCWRCSVTPLTMREFGSQAAWRSSKTTHWELMQSIRDRGLSVSPLFSSPGVVSDIFAIDWLHCTDLGVTCDFLGNLFWHITGGRPAQVAQLYKDICEFYKVARSPSRLDGLTVLMLRKKASKSPKLRAKAAEARCLVPFAAQLAAQKLGDPTDSVQVTIKSAADHLAKCYECLHQDLFEPEKMKYHSIQFLLLYKALEDQFGPKLWKIKPKFHLFAESCTSGSNPSASWVYRDEDFGGTLANYSRRRGGRHTVLNVSQVVLNRFRAQNDVRLLG